jgi:hypothetical protein
MLLEMAAALAWRRSYSAASVGAEFYEGYGWSEFAGLTGPVQSARLACGVLLLAPHVHYPLHRHEAEEIYVPLSGTARWQQGRAPSCITRGTSHMRCRPPGSRCSPYTFGEATILRKMPNSRLARMMAKGLGPRLSDLTRRRQRGCGRSMLDCQSTSIELSVNRG